MLVLDFVGEDFVFAWSVLLFSSNTFWSAHPAAPVFSEHCELFSQFSDWTVIPNRGAVCAWRWIRSGVILQTELCHARQENLHLCEFSAWLNQRGVIIKCIFNLDSRSKVRMQVSLVCTDHRGGVSRNTEDRLNRQNANSPSTGTRSKFRAVAMVARSLGQLSVQSVPSSSEQSMKTGMKYR